MENIALWTTNTSLCCSSFWSLWKSLCMSACVFLWLNVCILFCLISVSHAIRLISILTLYGDTIFYLRRKWLNSFFFLSLCSKTHTKNKQTSILLCVLNFFIQIKRKIIRKMKLSKNTLFAPIFVVKIYQNLILSFFFAHSEMAGV